MFAMMAATAAAKDTRPETRLQNSLMFTDAGHLWLRFSAVAGDAASQILLLSS